MTGLENILKMIEAETDSRAKEIISKAKLESDEIIAKATAEAEKITKSYEEKAETKARETVERSKATDEIEAKRTVLGKKQELIKKALDNAKAEITGGSAEDYFTFLGSILEKTALKDSGKVVLPEKDFEEITPKFKGLLDAKQLTAEKGNILPRNGFVIVYGSIEINCTVDAIIDARADEISDSLNTFLFGSEGGK
ncbi:MAG: hypothetical protein IJ285_04920 [Clostridia bacterium]|nr:hypothetical protein [Clostridia bacterium]